MLGFIKGTKITTKLDATESIAIENVAIDSMVVSYEPEIKGICEYPVANRIS